jgi:hypothetical protein
VALGVFHDTTIADELIAQFAGVEGADVKLSIGPVNRWLTKYQRGLRKKVIELWGEFANQKPFWDVA